MTGKTVNAKERRIDSKMKLVAMPWVLRSYFMGADVGSGGCMYQVEGCTRLMEAAGDYHPSKIRVFDPVHGEKLYMREVQGE